MALGNDGPEGNWRADPSGRARLLPGEANNGNSGMVGPSGRPSRPTSGDGSGGGLGARERMPSFFGGGGTPVVQNTIPRASSFGVFDHNISREEAAARYAVFEAARGDWSTRRREEETVPSRPSAENDRLVRELVEQNRVMMQRMAQVEEQRAEDQRRADRQRTEDLRRAEDLQRQLALALNNVVGQAAAAPAALPRVERKLDPVAMAQIPEFHGRRDEYVTEWVELVHEVATSYNWTDGQRRQAAVSKLRSSARDWYVEYGQGAFEGWEEWREAFVEAFGCTLTMNQWIAQVMGKVRRQDETVRSYCYSKIKICGRYPGGALPEMEVIRYLTLGMNNPQAESFILTSRARTMDDFFVAIREWEEFALDREQLEPEYPLSKPVAIPVVPCSGQGPPSPTLEKVNSLIERMDKLQSQWTDVGTRFSRPATPVDPRTFSGFQHPYQQPAFRQPANYLAPHNNQGVQHSLSAGPVNPQISLTQSSRPSSVGPSTQQIAPRRPSVHFATDTQSFQPRRASYGSCFRCGQMGHIAAHCPNNTTEESGRSPRSSSGNA